MDEHFQIQSCPSEELESKEMVDESDNCIVLSNSLIHDSNEHSLAQNSPQDDPDTTIVGEPMKSVSFANTDVSELDEHFPTRSFPLEETKNKRRVNEPEDIILLSDSMISDSDEPCLAQNNPQVKTKLSVMKEPESGIILADTAVSELDQSCPSEEPTSEGIVDESDNNVVLYSSNSEEPLT